MAEKYTIHELTLGDVVKAVCEVYRIRYKDIYSVQKACSTFYRGALYDSDEKVIITEYKVGLKKRQRRKGNSNGQ